MVEAVWGVIGERAARPRRAIAVHPMTLTLDAAQLLYVEMYQVAGSPVLVAFDAHVRIEIAEPREAASLQHPGYGRGRQA